MALFFPFIIFVVS